MFLKGHLSWVEPESLPAPSTSSTEPLEFSQVSSPLDWLTEGPGQDLRSLTGDKGSLYLVYRVHREPAEDMGGGGGEWPPLGTLKLGLPQDRRAGQTRPHIPQCKDYSGLRYY